MQIEKITKIEQSKLINDLLLLEPTEENTHPFFIHDGIIDSHNIFTLRKNDECIGVLFLNSHDEESAEIYKLYIFHKYRGRNYGKETVLSVIELLKQHGYTELLVEVLTLSVVPFWKKLGFIPLDSEWDGNMHFSRPI
ncbi:GNAT family N-acetyltransferase [Citrobacter portucalensis]|uniref:GNAT family N-acetyltransferase n=1 Tax=Citrobacter portucalensis TaxID=1639133 RepID=UPI0010A2D15B|nr:GNAT family N-acetyltransferase [Citrobacter portucalensis]QCD02226.1 GNAT family N-acetyltransferase [Citrobacter portucalensis]